MTTLQRRGGWATVVLLPPLIVVALVLNLLPNPRLGGPTPHFYIVTFTAGLLAVFALLMAVASVQVRDVRAFFLASTFISISGIFVAHALTTPTALVPYSNPWVGFSASFSVLVGATFLALSTLNWSAAIERLIVTRQRDLFAGIVALLVLYNLLTVYSASTRPPRAKPPLPEPRPMRRTSPRRGRSWRVSRSPSLATWTCDGPSAW